MNIISQFNEFLGKSFNIFLKNYFLNSNYWYKSSDISNYYNLMNDLDSFSNSFMKDVIVSYFEYMDNVFFNSSYRKNFCESKGFCERKNFVTIFGNINFKRRYYYDKKTNEHFFFVDYFLGIPKRKRFDPIICSELVDKASEYSYSKSGKLVSEKIGKKIDNNFFISRATARNIVLSFNPIVDEEIETKRIERLFIMLDEKFVPSQFNDNNDHMIKASVIFENTKLEYKTKRKPDSVDRYRLVNSHTCASINNELLSDTLNYIYNNYDVNYLKELYFMGDCANWITHFPKSHWFNFTSDTKVQFSMDGFHFAQAIKHITTNKHLNWYNTLIKLVELNDKDLFEITCMEFIKQHTEREEIILEKMKYILNNWNYLQIYQNNNFLKCSMESHISHIFADLFTSRPKAYSKKGLEKLLKIRLLKVNGYDLKKLYIQSLNKVQKEKDNILNNNLKKYKLKDKIHESTFEKEYKALNHQFYLQKQIKPI